MRGADHEVHMVEADVAPSGDELLVGQFLASDEGEAVGASDGDVAGGVLVEERVVEEVSALGDGRTGRDEGDLAEMLRAFVCVDQPL